MVDDRRPFNTAVSFYFNIRVNRSPFGSGAGQSGKHRVTTKQLHTTKAQGMPASTTPPPKEASVMTQLAVKLHI